MLIEQAEIRRLIPHAGSMCLLDGVIAWDADSIACVSSTHRDPANPLRRDGRLAAVHAIEYGAQAVAIHGGLLAGAAGQRTAPAYLAAIRDVKLKRATLDDLAGSLEITARRLVGEQGNAIYAVVVQADGEPVVTAKVTIVKRPVQAA